MTVTIAVVAALATLVLAVGIGTFLLVHVTGSPQDTATTFLTDWQAHQYAEMDTVTVNAPAGGVAGPLRASAAQLNLRSLHLKLGPVTQNGSSAQAKFTATATIAGGQVWTYQGQLPLVISSRAWFVSWSPSVIFPSLQSGQRFALHAVWPARGQVLAADGTVLSSPKAVARSGSIALVSGNVVRATAVQAKKLGPPYQAGDLIGLGGVEQAYEQQLAGRPALTIQIVGPGKKVDATAARLPATAGVPVRTSIVMRDQIAASSLRPAGCSPSSTGPADSTARSRACSRPAPPSRWSPPPPSAGPG